MEKFYFAPLEGISGYVYRKAYEHYFGGIDKYFIPFIKPNQKGKLSSREKNDILPMHNQGMCAIPQILTNSAEDFIKTAERLGEYGYEEVNLNLGCPSKTVVSKGRGAGFLAEPDSGQSEILLVHGLMGSKLDGYGYAIIKGRVEE